MIVVLTVIGFDKMTISSTGFVDVELLHIGKTVRLLGEKNIRDCHSAGS